MRTKNLLALFIVLMGMTGMVGIVSANPDPCPNLNGAEWGQSPSPSVLVVANPQGGNLVKYSASAANQNPSGGIPGFREVCVAGGGAPATPSSFSVLWAPWNGGPTGIKDLADGGFVQFGPTGNSGNIPFDGNLHDVGTVQWGSAPTEKYLVHVISADLCGGTTDAPNTCFVVPGNGPPVPELSPAILTSVGLLGLVFVSRRYKRQREI